ncbi:hypothetical protein PACTADRAFT_47693 [Pachysolen tannophilus NRRL Y-2460]|uniref:glucan 1,3-beta-glucosidase n=1 Tax=Pachysolen tannophilus NRRL Y-2460 TaxID=669874 RepID=A0A1E4U1H6_PACTA|nr:hypothetical protein PACTADRAFT_47693 [Pachysolen tannophilus NRRL Y-2460]
MLVDKKLIAAVVALASATVSAKGSFGFDLGVVDNDDNCKDADDYIADLDAISGYTSHVKTYAVSDCNTLQILGPVLEDKGFTITLGVWPTDDNHFDEEISALQSYLPTISKSVISEITVGSEVLYRGDLTADQLASKITQVKSTISSITDKNGDSYSDIPVGTVDSWNCLVDSSAVDAITASDFVFANAFSYWQGQTLANASFSFFDDIMQALQVIQTAKGSTDILFAVGETGWPTQGTSYGDAVPSTANAQTFFEQGVCAMLGWGVDVIYFEAFDEPWKAGGSGTADVEPYYGAFDDTRTLKFPLTCNYTGSS